MWLYSSKNEISEKIIVSLRRIFDSQKNSFSRAINKMFWIFVLFSSNEIFRFLRNNERKSENKRFDKREHYIAFWFLPVHLD